MTINFEWLFLIPRTYENKILGNKNCYLECAIKGFTIEKNGDPISFSTEIRDVPFGIKDELVCRVRLIFKTKIDIKPKIDNETGWISHKIHFKDAERKLEIFCEDNISIIIGLGNIPCNIKEVVLPSLIDSYVYFDEKEYVVPLPYIFENGEIDVFGNRTF